MISNKLANIVSSMKAHSDAETATPAVMNIFIGRLEELLKQVREQEAEMVPHHLRGSFQLRSEDDVEKVVPIRPHLRRAPAKRSGGDGAA